MLITIKTGRFPKRSEARAVIIAPNIATTWISSMLTIIPIVFSSFNFSITNSAILCFASSGIAFLFYNFACANAKLIPHA
jgi:hypothetical protein